MNRFAGSGLQLVEFASGGLWFQGQPGGEGNAVTMSWFLPAGNWWRVDLVTAVLNVELSLADVTYHLSALFNAQQLWRISGPAAMAAGVYAGNVNFATQSPYFNGTLERAVNSPLPDVYLPGGTEIILATDFDAGTVSLASGSLIARSASNVIA